MFADKETQQRPCTCGECSFCMMQMRNEEMQERAFELRGLIA